MTRHEGEKRPEQDILFHAIPEQDLYAALASTAQGLTSQQVLEQRERYGANDISHLRKRPAILQFLDHLKNPLVIILLLAAGVSLVVGDVVDAAIIFIIVLASVTLDFFQEYKAGNAAELLNRKS